MSFPFDLYNNLIISPVPAVPTVQDLVDPNTGVVQSVRYIDPLTQDYAVAADGHLEGMNSIQQQITMCILTTFGTAVAPIGQAFLSPGVVVPTLIVNQMTNLVQSALANLINSGAITLTNVQVTVVKGGQVRMTVFCVDNVTGQTYQNNIGS